MYAVCSCSQSVSGTKESHDVSLDFCSLYALEHALHHAISPGLHSSSCLTVMIISTLPSNAGWVSHKSQPARGSCLIDGQCNCRGMSSLMLAMPTAKRSTNNALCALLLWSKCMQIPLHATFCTLCQLWWVKIIAAGKCVVIPCSRCPTRLI